MKTYSQLLEELEPQEILTEMNKIVGYSSTLAREHAVESTARSMGLGKFVGLASNRPEGKTGNGWFTMHLFEIDAFDKKTLADDGVVVKPGEVVYRYMTTMTARNRVAPLIRINLNTGRAYFLSQKSHETGVLEFEASGKKLMYVTFQK